jgi:hypothetical protein
MVLLDNVVEVFALSDHDFGAVLPNPAEPEQIGRFTS